MDISPIRASAAPHRAWVAQAALAQSRAAAPQATTPAAPAQAAAPRPTRKSELAPLDVQIETRPGGGHQLTIVDKTTGQVYAQLPPEQIVQVLEEALRRMQHREDG